jgi:hypothetical protein
LWTAYGYAGRRRRRRRRRRGMRRKKKRRRSKMRMRKMTENQEDSHRWSVASLIG